MNDECCTLVELRLDGFHLNIRQRAILTSGEGIFRVTKSSVIIECRKSKASIAPCALQSCNVAFGEGPAKEQFTQVLWLRLKV